MGEPVLERLRQGPVLCDGAMGTMLYARAAESQMHGRCFDELTLTNPALVQEVHRAYIQAGAQVIETNTFGANQAKLSAYGLGDRVREINLRAAQLAREAREIAGQAVFVAGAVGPSGLLNLPTQPAPGASSVRQTSVRHTRGRANVGLQGEDEASEAERRLATLRAVFRDQIEALVAGGVDLIILETISSIAELRQAALAAREVGPLPLIAQMTFSEEGQTLAGETPAEVARAMATLGVDGVGVNCSMGPAGILDAVSEMADALHAEGLDLGGDILLTAQPNAGLPTRIENRFLYVST
ncbi:MAG TPA: homocysteine S-methyltransferase family protein, partial [Ktedonobacterales bacterium]|nr:homocysteine S-methyltransferase family protein [Ktedonobacterales bacterium]